MGNVFFPETMKAMHNWCAWRLESRNGRMTKMPYQINGKRASTTDPDTWTTFDEVSKLLAIDDRYAGYGFMISPGFVFCDCDHCFDDNGNMDERGADIVSAFSKSFCEVSQSKHGLHVITRGIAPANFNNRKCGVEMYGDSRFVAMTGNALQALEPTEEQEGINYIANKYGTKKAYNRNKTSGKSVHDDNWIIRHASAITGKKGRDFSSLFSGDTSQYTSLSEADSALCCLLAFWCDRDPEQIDRLFRQSGLYRKKWERQDYRTRTIDHACAHVPETVSEWMKRSYDETSQSASVLLFLKFGE